MRTLKPPHYKLVCISLYTRDIERLEDKVGVLRQRGHSKMSKSQLIRIALNRLDINSLPAPVEG